MLAGGFLLFLAFEVFALVFLLSLNSLRLLWGFLFLFIDGFSIFIYGVDLFLFILSGYFANTIFF